jgi:hypothetical protein
MEIAMFEQLLSTAYPWYLWLGVASGLMLVIGLVLAAARRTDGDVYRFEPPRREPMPLYEEGVSS